MTRPAPARYPAGARVLVEFVVNGDGQLRLARRSVAGLAEFFWPSDVTVHGTVAEYEQLQAELRRGNTKLAVATDALSSIRAIVKPVDVEWITPSVIVADVDALRTERDNLTANAARLRQERDEADAVYRVCRRDRAALHAEIQQWKATYGEHALADATSIIDERNRLRAEVKRLRAEVTRIADELEAGAVKWDQPFRVVRPLRIADELRAALATRAPQPAVVAATPPDGAGVETAPHQLAGGSVGHDGAEEPRG